MVNYGLKDRVAIITGANNPWGIGATTALLFAREGAKVVLVYKKIPREFDENKTDQNGVDRYFKANAGSADDVESKLKEMGADYLILESDISCEGGSIINISSSRDRMSQPQTESYTAAKGGISALTHALSVSFAGKVRVNSVSPGWIDTVFTEYSGPDAIQQPAGRVGNPLDIANMVLYLCSDMAGFITAENICIDGGMTKQMIYHGDHGWSLDENIN